MLTTVTPRTLGQMAFLFTCLYLIYLFKQPDVPMTSQPLPPSNFQHWTADHFITTLVEIKALHPALQNAKARQIMEEWGTHNFEWQDEFAQFIVKAMNRHGVNDDKDDEQVVMHGNKDSKMPQSDDDKKPEDKSTQKELGKEKEAAKEEEKPKEIEPLLQDPQRLWTKKDYLKEALRTPSGDAIDFSAIKDMCKTKEWNPKIVFSCFRMGGGVTNVRNEFMTCLRFAMEAGAGLIVPLIVQRSTSNLADMWAGAPIDLNYMFDHSVFAANIKSACPQMKVYETLTDIKKDGEVDVIGLLNMESDLKHESVARKVMADPSTWKPLFLEWVKNRAPKDPNRISVINVANMVAYFPICYDPPKFVSEFGNLLSFHTGARRLAASALFKLSTDYYLPSPVSPRLPSTSPLAAMNFLGLHLRTSMDAAAAGWANYSVQSTRYLQLADEQRVKHIYIASGNNEDVQKFAAAALPRLVVTKRDLLNKDELKELDSLTWDQQAMVDWLVITRASFFAGIVQSSFAWNIALMRGNMMGRDVCGGIGWEERLKMLKEEDKEVQLKGKEFDDPTKNGMKDEWNEILGVYGGAREMGYGIWP